MPRSKVIAAALAASLSACNPPVIPAVVTSDITAIITEAQNICGVVANYADIAALVGGMIPGVDTIDSLANLVCTGVAALPAARFRATAGPKALHIYLHGKVFVVHVK